MSVVFSQKPVVQTTIRADTSAHLRSDLDAILLQVGWIHDATLTNGFRYKITTPQIGSTLVAYCVVQDTGAIYRGAPVVSIWMQTSTGTRGRIHYLIYNDSHISTFTVVAGAAQLFIYLPGYTSSSPGNGAHTVSVGIPYTTDPSVTEIWWSCGSSSDYAFSFAANFRYSYYCDDGWSAAYNGAVIAGAPSDGTEYTTTLRIYPVTDTSNNYVISARPRSVRYSTLTPLFLDPIIGWNYKIYGQLWDAFLMSDTETLDSSYTSVEVNASGDSFSAKWTCYGPTRQESLFLLVTNPEGSSNIVY